MLSRYVPRAPSGAVALVILAAYFGLAAILARYLATGIGLFEQWYLRFGTGFVIALVVFRRRIDLGKFRRLPRREWLVLVARVGSGSVAAVAFYTLAVQHAKIGQVVLLQAFPILAILSVVLTRERLTPAKGLLVLISFFGVALVAVVFELFLY